MSTSIIRNNIRTKIQPMENTGYQPADSASDQDRPSTVRPPRPNGYLGN